MKLQGMVAQKRRNNNIISLKVVGPFLLLFDSYTVYLSSVLFMQTNWGAPLVMFLGLVMLVVLQHGKILKDTKLNLIALLTYSVVIMGNQSIANGRYSYLFFYSISIVFYLFAKGSIRWIDDSLSIMRLFATIYSVATIAFVFTPSFYTGTVTKLFGSYAATAIQQYNNGNMPGLTANCSTNAMYLCIGIGVSISLLFSNHLKKKAYGNINTSRSEYYIIILELCALLLTGKRGPTLFMVMSFSVLYLIQSSKEGFMRWFKLIFIFMTAVVLFFVIISFVPALGRVYYKNLELLEGGNILTGRQSYYEAAYDTFLSNKIFGIGWGGMEIFITSITWNNASYNVHNIYLQLLAETGIVGFTIFMLFFGTNLIYTIKYTVLKIKGNSLQNITPLLFSCYIQVFFLLYGFTGNPLYDIQMLIPYYFAIAISSAIKIRERRTCL